MKRKICVYGNPDKSDLGFAQPGDLTRYIQSDLWTKENGRYRYTQGWNVDIIVMSRDGLAFGHLNVEEKVKPNDEDRAAFPSVRYVYKVTSSSLYATPVRLSQLGITKIRYGKELTESQFAELLNLAGGVTEYSKPLTLPESPNELDRILTEVRARLGQSEFRRRLLSAYSARCAITGCDAAEALEAAHIQPYSGLQSNDPSNGLLLRADIHTLFDLGLIGIDPASMSVVLAQSLKNTYYDCLAGTKLALPNDDTAHPNASAIAERWNQFGKPPAGSSP